MTNETPAEERFLSAGQRWGRWHFIRVIGLTCFYFPFWRSVNAMRRAYRAAFTPVSLLTHEELWKLTEALDEHPDGWDHPCMCATCRSYADG